MRSRNFPFWSVIAVLAGSILVNIWPRHPVISFSPSHPLKALVPIAPAGWTVKDLPLGQSEFQAGENAKTLNFSDYFYKVYSNGKMSIRVYTAYWEPGRMDPAVVWQHRPDICWTCFGGIELAADDSRILPGVNSLPLAPAFYREFEFPTGRESVVFWHMVGGRESGYGVHENNFIASRIARFTRSFSLAAGGIAPKEQIMIRISTDRTIEDLLRSELWPKLAQTLLSIGLYPKGDAIPKA